MTTTAITLGTREDRAKRYRLLSFGLLLVASALWGGLAVAFGETTHDATWLLWLTAYVCWVLCDTWARGESRNKAILQLLLSLLPMLGLLLYMVLTRGWGGLLQWCAFVLAVLVPAGMGALLAFGIVRFVQHL